MTRALLVGGRCDGDTILLEALEPEISVRRFVGTREVAVSPEGAPVCLDFYTGSAQRYRLCPLGPEMPVYTAVSG